MHVCVDVYFYACLHFPCLFSTTTHSFCITSFAIGLLLNFCYVFLLALQLHIQIDRLKSSGRDAHRRRKMLQSQVKTLCEERADFLAQLQDQYRDINQLRKQLGLAEKENEDLVKSCSDDPNDPNRPRYTTLQLKELICERDELITTVDNLTEELKALKPSNAKTTAASGGSGGGGDSSSYDYDDEDDDVDEESQEAQEGAVCGT